ncbi:acyl carrier protein [Agrobacterium tumefaciens]|uniref:acyl carrier protein n=1 Tax=Agrobacterium tumefaciens TaxID=358 RepID=UPI000977044A|nr:hypothetical protein BV900_15030 [Agrobacterium tumefaciens]
MNTPNINDAIRNILVEHLYVECKPEDIGLSDTLRADLGVDSLGFVELKEQVEKSFKIVIPDSEFTPDNFATVETVAKLVNKKLGEN